ncbi:MAG: hypothetical protein K0R31_230 [Clostridiales bacterium]|jgi:hypothetical protein|nr:hypothetical protein [Clostridiales bacterium]
MGALLIAMIAVAEYLLLKSIFKYEVRIAKDLQK